MLWNVENKPTSRQNLYTHADNLIPTFVSIMDLEVLCTCVVWTWFNFDTITYWLPTIHSQSCLDQDVMTVIIYNDRMFNIFLNYYLGCSRISFSCNCDSFMKYSRYSRYHMFCTLKSVKVYLTWNWKQELNILMYGGNKNHNNPYLHSTTVLCDYPNYVLDISLPATLQNYNYYSS